MDYGGGTGEEILTPLATIEREGKKGKKLCDRSDRPPQRLTKF